MSEQAEVWKERLRDQGNPVGEDDTVDELWEQRKFWESEVVARDRHIDRAEESIAQTEERLVQLKKERKSASFALDQVIAAIKDRLVGYEDRE